MKNILIVFIFVFALNLSAQDKKERIKALKIAFITEHLKLTETEAQQFWPIYNAFEAKNNQLRKQSRLHRKNIDFEALSETEATDLLNETMAIESKKNKITEDLIKDLMKVLPTKKIVLLKITEDAFNKRMFEEFKRRGQEGKRP